MKLLIDACVLYPTVMREMVLGAAKARAFEPLWSSRILGEWERAAIKLGPAGAAQASGEIALLRAHWPKAIVSAGEGLQARLWLPDPDDIHVLAAAIAGHADGIMTLNNKDFPAGILAEEGLSRVNPDAFLFEVAQNQPDLMAEIADHVLCDVRRLSGEDWTLRALMKKARLPRLGKVLTR